MKLVDLFTDLAKKAGITDLTDPKFKDFLSSQLEIDDDTAKKIQSELFNMEAAKANQTLRSHFHAQSMRGVDTEVDRWLTDEDYSDDDKTEIKGLDSSTKKMVTAYNKKIAKLNARMEEIKKGTGKQAQPGELEKLRNDINVLNADIGKIKADHASEITKLNEQHIAKMNEKDLDFILSSYNYAFPKEMKLPAKIAAVKAVLMPELTSKGLKLAGNNGTLELQKSDGTKYFNEANQETSLTQFIDKVLADNNLLAVAEPNPGGGGGTGTPGTGGAADKVDKTLLDAVEQDLKAAGFNN